MSPVRVGFVPSAAELVSRGEVAEQPSEDKTPPLSWLKSLATTTEGHRKSRLWKNHFLLERLRTMRVRAAAVRRGAAFVTRRVTRARVVLRLRVAVERRLVVRPSVFLRKASSKWPVSKRLRNELTASFTWLLPDLT